MDLVKSYDFFQPEKVKGRIHIIGCGSIGSTLAENLARLGIENFVLYDFDKVEPHNLANQMFSAKDVGSYKVDAVEKIITDINPSCSILKYKSGYKDQVLAGYVFLCVDSIELRRQIVEACKNNSYIKAMFDFRTRLTDAQTYAIDWSCTEDITKLLKTMDFTHDEAKEATPMTACGTTLSVAPTVRMIVAAGVSNFMNFITAKTLKFLITIDAFNFDILAM